MSINLEPIYISSWSVSEDKPWHIITYNDFLERLHNNKYVSLAYMNQGKYLGYIRFGISKKNQIIEALFKYFEDGHPIGRSAFEFEGAAPNSTQLSFGGCDFIDQRKIRFRFFPHERENPNLGYRLTQWKGAALLGNGLHSYASPLKNLEISPYENKSERVFCNLSKISRNDFKVVEPLVRGKLNQKP